MSPLSVADPPRFSPRDLLRRASWRRWMDSTEFPLPILREAYDYNGGKLRHDLIAALTVLLVAIPQAVSFALLAGLPPEMVLGSMVVGGFVAALLFSSRQIVFGPTTSVSLILAATIFPLAQGTALGPAELAVILAFMIGAIQLAAGVLKLGDLSQFISRSVVIGYSAGIGVLMVLAQVPYFLGMERQRDEGLSLMLWHAVLSLANLHLDPRALGIGALTLALFWLIHRLRPKWPETLLTLGSICLVTIVWQLDMHGVQTLAEEGAIIAGLPNFTGIPVTRHDYSVFLSLASTALAIALLGMLEATAISKSLAARTGQRVNPNQDLAGMGAGNLASSLFSAMPGSASFARSAVNVQSGATTQFAALYGSLLTLGALLLLAPWLGFLPVAALAAHLARIGWNMIQWDQIRTAVRSTRGDAIVFWGTLVASLTLPLDTAIFLGIGLSLAIFLRKASTPTLVEYTFNDAGHLAELEDKSQRANEQISIIHVEGELFFGAADLFQSQVRLLAEDQHIRVFILRMKNARHLDATTVFAMQDLLAYLRATGRHLLVSGAQEDVMRVLRNSGLLAQLGEDNVFPSETNTTLATRRALQRASAILGLKTSAVRLFYDRPHSPASAPAADPPGAPAT